MCAERGCNTAVVQVTEVADFVQAKMIGPNVRRNHVSSTDQASPENKLSIRLFEVS
jgi:hypothetical protein